MALARVARAWWVFGHVFVGEGAGAVAGAVAGAGGAGGQGGVAGGEDAGKGGGVVGLEGFVEVGRGGLDGGEVLGDARALLQWLFFLFLLPFPKGLRRGARYLVGAPCNGCFLIHRLRGDDEDGDSHISQFHELSKMRFNMVKAAVSEEIRSPCLSRRILL